MTWHLKDRELEEALNKRSHPMHTFTDELNQKMAQIPKEQLPRVLVVEVTFQRIGTGGVILEGNVLEFSIEEIENVHDFNPHDWNKFPEITPPDNIWMRLEIFRVTPHSQHTYRNAAIFSGGRWRYGKNYIEIQEGDEVRFRPWED